MATKNGLKPQVDASALYEASAALHRHLCPRQVLGVRMGLLAGRLLGLELPQAHDSKRLLTIAETDGCAVDGISVATNCWVGRRTLRIEDYGKVAATFIDTHTGQAVRIVPSAASRAMAAEYAPEGRNRWERYLLGYQRIPLESLFEAQAVELNTSLEQLLSHAGRKAVCEDCGEEVINDRQVEEGGLVLCRPCAQGAYYRLAGPPVEAEVQAEHRLLAAA